MRARTAARELFGVAKVLEVLREIALAREGVSPLRGRSIVDIYTLLFQSY